MDHNCKNIQEYWEYLQRTYNKELSEEWPDWDLEDDSERLIELIQKMGAVLPSDSEDNKDAYEYLTQIIDRIAPKTLLDRRVCKIEPLMTLTRFGDNAIMGRYLLIDIMGHLLSIRSEGEICVFFAHEIAHFVLAHSYKQQLFEKTNPDKDSLDAFKLKQERQADDAAMDILKLLGYSPDYFYSFFNRGPIMGFFDSSDPTHDRSWIKPIDKFVEADPEYERHFSTVRTLVVMFLLNMQEDDVDYVIDVNENQIKLLELIDRNFALGTENQLDMMTKVKCLLKLNRSDEDIDEVHKLLERLENDKEILESEKLIAQYNECRKLYLENSRVIQRMQK